MKALEDRVSLLAAVTVWVSGAVDTPTAATELSPGEEVKLRGECSETPKRKDGHDR